MPKLTQTMRTLAGGVAALTLAAGTAQAETIKSVTLQEWQPYAGPNLPDQGFCQAVTKAALSRAGHNVQLDLVPWQRAVNGAQNGDFDVFSCVWKTSDRQEYLAYPEPFFTNRLVFMTQEGDSFSYNSVDDLSGMTIGTVDYAYPESFQNADSFERSQANNLRLNIRKLRAGRVDAVVGDEGVLRYLAEDEFGSLDGFAFADGALTENGLYSAISRAHPNHEQLVEDFNAGLEEIRADGTMDELLAEHGLTE